MEIFEEEEEEWPSPVHHLIAGAIAGVVEHCGMFPIDTIKTNIQAHGSNQQINSVRDILRPMHSTMKDIINKGGIMRLFRGINATAFGAAPAHAVYFASYEQFKSLFGRLEVNPHISYFIAGMIASASSDAVFVPMDSVKQKMQLLSSKNYTGMFDCIKRTYQSSGIFRGFYAGYTTTISMNVPYNGIYFVSYEFFKRLFSGESKEHSNWVTLSSGGCAGVVASGLTNPLDVARTRLQTQTETQSLLKYRNMHHAVGLIWKEEGVRGMTSGILPRMIFHSTSAALCWLTYEYIKVVLK